MRKLSLMTLNMFAPMLFQYQVTKDMEGLKETYEEMMELVGETGYEAVDVSGLELSVFGEEYVKTVLHTYGLKVSSYIYFDQFGSMEESGVKPRIDRAREAVDTAVRLGTKVLMLVPAKGSPMEPGVQENLADYTPEAIRAQLVRHWIPAAAYATERGIAPVVEDTPELGFHFCRIREVKEVLDAVPGLKLVYDSGNMLLVGEDPVAYYEAFADRTAHIHLKDMRMAGAKEMADVAADGSKMTCAPTGTGLVDLAALMGRIREHGYEGYLTVEFTVDEDNDYRKSLIRSREYLERML